MNDEMRRLDDERFRQMESHLMGIAETTNKIMNNHLEHIAEDLKGFGINPAASSTTNSGLFSLM